MIGTLAMVGCSHPAALAPATVASGAASPCKGPEPLRVVLTATARLNPGEKGEALATVIRLYQLKGITKLMGVSFDDLLDHDKETLGDELIAVQDLTLNPGERLEPTVVRNPETNYLLAVALFRQPAGTTWKTTKRLSPPNPQFCEAGAQATNDGTVRLALDENRIELR